MQQDKKLAYCLNSTADTVVCRTTEADVSGSLLLETYARLSQSTSPAASAALVVHTILLGMLCFRVDISKLVRYACPK